MKKYTYENATVYITKPSDKQLRKIQAATEIFLRKVVKENMNVIKWDVRSYAEDGANYCRERCRDRTLE